MYMDIRLEKIKNDFIKRAKPNANFVIDMTKDYQKAQIVLSLDEITYKLKRNIYNIDVFQIYFEE